ncbi:LOB domain-containing protein 20 [Phtheirospermum japonicum]|uniref:LOB domain-containing protein 20 n=1 Tax=Phtheirospermum japonicum TaxID=374723 RepID=A0A830CRJ2_9LAMI|nr:LOB domain-containing protein 20 [Phtheirospermum japonicum]
MDVSKGDGTSENRRRGPGKRTAPGQVEAADGAPPANAPCGACKFLRRKCISGCIFAPHFGSDQGAARFAAVHKVFGASNVSKLLSHIPANRRHDAVVTISYEAQARLSDPIYGCVSTIIALQQQVASLQAELSLVQTQLLNSRFVMASALQSSPPPQHHHHHIAAVLQPAYSGTSSASINHISMNSFGPNLGETALSNSFEHMPHLSGRAINEDEDEEEESHDPVAFANHIFH